jgi:hypothetical protein
MVKFSFKKSKDETEELDRQSVKVQELKTPTPPVQPVAAVVTVEPQPNQIEEDEVVDEPEKIQYVEREINLTLINEKLNQQTLMLKAIMEAMGFEIK